MATAAAITDEAAENVFTAASAMSAAAFDQLPAPPIVGDISVAWDDNVGTFAVTAEDDGELVGWLWDFGDGGAAEGPSPQHDYGGPGTFLVRVRLTDDAGLRNTRWALVEVGGPIDGGTTGGGDDGADTGDGDSGGADGGEGSTGDAPHGESGAPSGSEDAGVHESSGGGGGDAMPRPHGADEGPAAGCGCAAAPGASLPWLGLMPLAPRRGRRGSSRGAPHRPRRPVR